MALDLEKDIQDLENILDSISEMLGDAGLAVKAAVKGRIKSFGTHSILLKRNQNVITELLTRYELDKVKTIPVYGSLYDFFTDSIPIANDIDAIEKALSITIEDFNLDVLDLLTEPKQDKVFAKLINSKYFFDNISNQLITSGMVESNDAVIKSIKSKDSIFLVSSIYNRTLRGVLVHKDESIIEYRSFSYTRTPTPPKLIPVSLLNSIIENFLGHEDADIRNSIALYKRAIKGTGKYLRVLEKQDMITLGRARVVTESIITHTENLVNTLAGVTDKQYDFIRAALKQLESSTTAYLATGTL